MKKLKPHQMERAEGFIIETGFSALFLILKLYNLKTERDEEIKKDLTMMRDSEDPPKPSSKVFQSLVDHKQTTKGPSHFGSLSEQHLQLEPDFSHEDTLGSSSKTVIEGIELTSDYMKQSEKEIFQEASKFFYFYSSKVEILRDDSIQEIYFIKMPYSVYLEDTDKEKFNIEVDRKTTLNKVKSLFSAVDYLGSMMKFGYFLNSSNFLFSLLFKHEAAYTLLSFLTACIVNILIILSFATENTQDQTENMTSASLVQQVDQQRSSLA